MRLTLGITTKYIDRNPTASMTKNPLAGNRLRTPWVLSCEQQIIALSKVRNVNKANILGHKNVLAAQAFLICLAFYFEMRRRMSTKGMLQISTMNYAWLRLVAQAFN
jgi:hypothetical protein